MSAPKDSGPEIPTPQDLSAFAKEYHKAYMETIEEKKPSVYPKFAQEAPYSIQCYLLPNGCICMVFNSAPELKVKADVRDWDQVQEAVVKGVDHFAGFFPFEGRSLGDWNKRGKRDALRDLRLVDKLDLSKAGGRLEAAVEDVEKMIKANPWLRKSATEVIAALRDLESRVKGGFPTVDAIATLQSLKAYAAGVESVTIEFPDREFLQEISDGIKDLASLAGKLEMIETRMFEIEKQADASEAGKKVADLGERVERMEAQLEKVSNILTMLNTKVEDYFSKSAEKQRQAELERRIEEHAVKHLAHDSKLEGLEKEAEKIVSEMKTMAAKMEKDVHESKKRIARVEKHFMDFAKMVQE